MARCVVVVALLVASASALAAGDANEAACSNEVLRVEDHATGLAGLPFV